MVSSWNGPKTGHRRLVFGNLVEDDEVSHTSPKENPPPPSRRLRRSDCSKHRRDGVGAGVWFVPLLGAWERAPDLSSGQVASASRSDDGPSAGHSRSGPQKRNKPDPGSRRPDRPHL